jgi:predicted DNA-binding protein (MmcQ/YjbR family)
MKYAWLDGYLLEKAGAERDFKIEWQWQRYLVRGKMFAGLCTPDPKYKPHEGRTMVMLKCDPKLAELFRQEYQDVVPGFYCDKRCWNSIYLDGTVPDEVLKRMCDMSYQLVLGKLPKKVREEVLHG